MTLILTTANTQGVYQSSDYQLTAQGTGKIVSDEAGSKQLHATFQRLDIQLAFTGVAMVSGRRTIDWLLAELKALPQIPISKPSATPWQNAVPPR